MTRRLAASAGKAGAVTDPAEGAAGAAAGSVTRLLAAAQALRDEVATLTFAPPVTHVYNPLDYAWEGHRQYLERFGRGPKRIVFLGMNPGPFGMMQTGVPFGEVAAVRGWMGIEASVQAPAMQHAKRPIEGFDCRRSEVSGRRLWAWAALRYGDADRFFSDCFVLNYCPLVFLEASCRNRTPEQLPAAELAAALRGL
jgi:single-strand selective monofunctional uracil DNA glycosylase